MKTTILGVSLALSLVVGAAAAEPAVSGLRCEYRADPLGIDVIHPWLSWVIQSARRGERQTAYELLVASSAETLARDQGDLWQTGKVASDQSVHVVYAGQPLVSRQQCFWKVRVWTLSALNPEPFRFGLEQAGLLVDGVAQTWRLESEVDWTGGRESDGIDSTCRSASAGRPLSSPRIHGGKEGPVRNGPYLRPRPV